LKRRQFLILTAGIGALASVGATADSYPSKPIRLIVPFAPGGSTDILARIIAEPLGKKLGQPVIIDNKGGAGGIVGTMEMIRSAPDGYTLVAATGSITAANPAINPAAQYNPESDMTAIIKLAATPIVLAVRSGFPAKNFTEFLAVVKKNPDRYTYGSPGVGGIIHLQMELFKSLTGTSIRHVPFRGAGPALLAVVAGQVDIAFDSLPSLMPYLADGRMVPLAVAAPARRKELPQVPTLGEVGLEPANRMGHFGLLGPKGMSADLIDRINIAARKAIDDPPTRKRIEDAGAIIAPSTPAEYAAEIRSFHKELRQLVVERKLTVE